MPPQTSLFQVFLRLRPPQVPKSQQTDSWLLVEPPTLSSKLSIEENAEGEVEEEEGKTVKQIFPTHTTLQPPNDSRKRAVERFGFTKIFQEEASQSDVFEETGTAESIRHLLQRGRDALVATLGVTGSGKSHTILGTKSQRGITQMALDVLFRSIGSNIRRANGAEIHLNNDLIQALQASDPSEAQIIPASTFLESVFDNGERARMSRAQTPMMGPGSRAQTPMMVGSPQNQPPGFFPASPPATRSAPHDLGLKMSLCPSPKQFALKEETETEDRSTIRAVLDVTDAQSPLSVPMERFARKEPWYPPSRSSFWSRMRHKKTPTKLVSVKDALPMHRRPPMPRSNAFPTEPDVSNFTVDIDRDADYVVLVSMYEVYNDRIFDLLSTTPSGNAPAMSTRAGAALQKGLLRRPLLFKNTELSPDRKVVAGLRKIVCNTYVEAMTVLEAGLIERRVAGTGSNSVSSRSHGFFCIEVKKNTGNRNYQSHADWTGGTLSIADLAGSERARNAKTTGSTLAEAGKINESLMYLGQCLQVQSDCQQDGSKPIVPFRQCKLTELLFSNSFPSQSNQNTNHRAPQKAIMIVTADPHGDFNATSQILRYSALAREVTVPRIPSVASVIVNSSKPLPQPLLSSDRVPASEQYLAALSQELEQATNEVRRLAEECNALAIRLAEEEIKRTEAELKLQATFEKSAAIEQEVREECWQEMEGMMDEEKERWRMAWEEEKIHGEQYLDGKIDILERTSQFQIYEDTDSSSKVDELERENDILRARLAAMEQEMIARSPTKKSKSSTKHVVVPAALVLQETSNTNVATNPFLASLRANEKEVMLKPTSTVVREEDIDVFDISPRKLSLRSSSATIQILEEPNTAKKKKSRKLTTRKWDLGDENEI